MDSPVHLIIKFLYDQYRTVKLITNTILFITDIFPKDSHPHDAFFWKELRRIYFSVESFL